MASFPVTAPLADNSTTPSPPVSDSAPPPVTSSSPPPPPTEDSPPPPAESPPPKASPPPSDDSSPPPPSNDNSSPPPPPPPSGNKSPPPHWTSPPPPPKTSKHLSPPAPYKSSSSEGGLMGGKAPLIFGVSAGVLVLIILVIIIIVMCIKKKKKPSNSMKYYINQPGGPQGGIYYYGGQNQNYYNASKPIDHIVNVPPPPGSGPPGGGWLQPPLPPPPPMISSSELSSSNFSGPRQPVLPPPSPNLALGFNKSTFTFDELVAATSGFTQANLLGQGGFGYVHKGVLPNGKVIAVKSLKSGSGQGEREFQAEVEIISRVHHRHLVSLVGYCIASDKRMLVYEFVPNNNLEFHLYGKDRPVLEWASRLSIALGSAKGLAYLHEDCHPRIIHRDIKAANILLDENFEAMVADFGLAKLSSEDVTHVSTRIMGTFGYLAPEYAASGKLTEKSDVFSYGVMLLELITGKRPVDTTGSYMEDSLVDWARPRLTQSLEDGNFDELADPRMEGCYNSNEMRRMVACANESIYHSGRRRPKMSQIVRALEGDVSLDDLNEGAKTGQLSSRYSSSNGSSDYDTAEMKKIYRTALSTSSEYSANPSSSSSEATNSRDISGLGTRSSAASPGQL